MARETFIDTSGFYSLLAADDSKHRAAEAWINGAEARKARAITSDYILDETATLLKSKGYRHLLPSFFSILADSQVIRIEWIDAERFSEAKEFFLRHDDHDYSFTDCVSFVLMRELGLKDVLTKDHHFAEAGFNPLLK